MFLTHANPQLACCRQEEEIRASGLDWTIVRPTALSDGPVTDNIRALEGASTRWVLAAGTMVGFAFLAKMGQAFLVLPAFGLVYVVAAPTRLRVVWR